MTEFKKITIAAHADQELKRVESTPISHASAF